MPVVPVNSRVVDATVVGNSIIKNIAKNNV